MSQQQSMLGVEKDENGNTLVKVFISYRRNDNLFNHLLDIVNRTMDKLNNDLLKDTEYRVDKVIDLNSISLGDKWQEKIDKDLSNSDILLAFITEAYLADMNSTRFARIKLRLETIAKNTTEAFVFRFFGLPKKPLQTN